MEKRLKRRQWALVSDGANAGKTTFTAANARTPIMVIDTDGRFDAVESLVNGPVLYPAQVFDPLDLAEELIDRVPKEKVATLFWDSMTKFYSVHARLAYMRNLAGKQKRTGSRAAEMVDKSNAMTIARDLAILGTDVFYSWHLTHGVNGTGKSEIRDMISAVEKGRLMTSINVSLLFIREKDRFGLKVESARDFGGRPANVGFTIWDEPGNYWRGGAERLERLIYTTFSGKAEAVQWGSEKIGNEDLGEVEGIYDYLKEQVRPDSYMQMFVAWIEHIDGLVANSNPKPVKVPDKPPEPKLEPPVEVKPEPEKPGESPAEAAEEIEVDPGNLADMKASWDEHKELYLNHVVFAAAKLRPDKYKDAGDALLETANYPMPEGIILEFKMDQRVTREGGEKILDFLVE